MSRYTYHPGKAARARWLVVRYPRLTSMAPTLHYVCYAKYDRISMSYEDCTQEAHAPLKKTVAFYR